MFLFLFPYVFYVARCSTSALPSPPEAEAILGAIIAAYPSLAEIRESVVLAVNEEYVSMDDVTPVQLRDGATIAVIPPLSGG